MRALHGHSSRGPEAGLPGRAGPVGRDDWTVRAESRVFTISSKRWRIQLYLAEDTMSVFQYVA